jgi:exodeoxyribonuclease-3
MKIATWNINGIKARLDTALTWVRDANPDVLCLQEIKCVDEAFPAAPFESLGYNIAVHGQKGFNGVAILAKGRLEDIRRGLPGDDLDGQARYLEATVSLPDTVITVVSLYLPNGNPVGTEKFSYKLAWLERLNAHAADLLRQEQAAALTGDFNVIPEPIDAKAPEQWVRDALYQPESRALFRRLEHAGLVDAVRVCHPGEGVYTFWDYQAGCWQKNLGIRIDHILLSPQAADRMAGAGIDRFTRGWEKPSDHVPVWVELDA